MMRSPVLIHCSPIFPPEQPAAGLEEEPRVHALAAELEIHRHLLAQRAHSLPPLDALASADREGVQPVEVAAQPAAVVDDHRVAGKGQLCGQHHHAVGRGTAGLAGDGVELGGIGAAALCGI